MSFYVRYVLCLCVFGAFAFLAPRIALGEDATNYTLTGVSGLMSVPDARFEPSGTLRTSFAIENPYWHGTISAQVANSLWIGVRQTSWAKYPWADPQGFYPGLDLKLRLLEETPHTPALAIGLQSAVGHRRMAGEYLVFSKRFGDFDVTIGLGWGRFAGIGIMSNPLRLAGDHFDGPRPTGEDGQSGARAADWFTGQDMGLLSGIAWRTPIEGLILKIDTNGQDYAVESASSLTDPTYEDRERWGAGLDWTPPKTPWLNMSFGTQGGKIFAGRVSISTNPVSWRVGEYRARPFACDHEPSLLRDMRVSGPQALAALDMDGERPAPLQITRAAHKMALIVAPYVRSFAITPYVMGFRGPVVELPRGPLESAGKGDVSAEELWHAIHIAPERAGPSYSAPQKRMSKGIRGMGGRIAEWLDLPWARKEAAGYMRQERWRVIVEGQGSLSDFDHGAPYRTSVLLQWREHRPGRALAGGASVRLNVADNLSSALSDHPLYENPARSDIAAFADNRVILEDAYAAFTHTFWPGVYGAIISGYLEEMYAGTGGEILWRPYKSRFALGVDAWWAAKRDPYTDFALGLESNNSHIATGHMRLHYDLPEGFWGPDTALSLSVGRYLAGDVGANLELSKDFANGAQVKAFGTITNEQDRGPYGEKLGAYAGLSLRVPLGSLLHVPAGSALHLEAAPLGRNAGQHIRRPIDLYDATKPLSLNHMAKRWGSALE